MSPIERYCHAWMAPIGVYVRSRQDEAGVTSWQPLIGVLLLAALVAIAFAAGGSYVGARKDAEIATIQRDHAQAVSDAATAHGRALLRAVERGQAAASASQAEIARLETLVETLKGRIPRVTTYRPSPAAPEVPVPDTVFTRGFVCLWNDAIGAASPDPACDNPAAGRAEAAADPAQALDSGVRQPDIAAAIVDYGQRCRGIESRYLRLIDYTEAP